jgi:outer membrane lipoprotein-sorting protein
MILPVRTLFLAVAATGAAIAPIAFIAPATAQTTRPAPAQATGDLLAVQRHLEAMTTLTADFSQADRRGQVQTGRLTLKQPGRIRFQYAPGIPLLVVADGRSLNVIDYEVRQVQRWPIRNSPLAVLIDPGANLMRYARLQPTSNNGTISVEVRDPARPEYGMLTMIFTRDANGPGGLELYGWVALDAQRNRTTVRLTNQQYNRAVEDSVFRWRDPRPQGPRNR